MSADHEKSDYFKARRSERVAVDSPTNMRHPHWYNVEVTVCDVSQCGFMAECAEPMEIGSYVSLDVPGVGPVNAQVRWQIGRRLGGMFLDPIRLNHCEWTAEKAEPPLQPA